MAGFWMHQVRLLGQPLGDRMGEFKFFDCICYSVRHPGGSRRCRAASKEVSGGKGKARAQERWTESCGKGLDHDFQVEAFSVKSGRFLCVFCGVQVAPGDVEQRPRRSQELKGSQNPRTVA